MPHDQDAARNASSPVGVSNTRVGVSNLRVGVYNLRVDVSYLRVGVSNTRAGVSNTGPFDAPCRTTKMPREIPPLPWHRQGAFQVNLMRNLPCPVAT
jgi:hypothetical protein